RRGRSGLRPGGRPSRHPHAGRALHRGGGEPPDRRCARRALDLAMRKRESASAAMGAAPEVVFGLVTDVSRLPEWNKAITKVVEAPGHLDSGPVWKLGIDAPGQSRVNTSRAPAP